MSHPFVLLAQQRAAQPASTLQGVQDGAREVKRVALDLLPFAAFTMVTAFGRSQKRGDVESVAAGLVAMVGTGIGVAVGRENALQGVLVTAASVATPVALLRQEYRENPAPEGPVVRKEEYEIKEVMPDASIRDFVKGNHYSRTVANTWSHVFAMFDRSSNELVGVAWWMPSMPEAHKSAIKWVKEHNGLEGERNMVLHLSRLVVAPGVPKNAAGLLLARSMKLLDRRKYPILLTYADSGVSDARTGEAHKGTVYRATNWTDAGDAPGGRVWVHSITGEQRGQKRGKINIPSAEMRRMGFVQKPALPKRRFIHVDERALRWAIAHKSPT